MKNIVDIFAERLAIYSKKPTVSIGLIGNIATGEIVKSGTAQTIYVTLHNGSIIEAFNNRVPNILSQPVIVGRDPNNMPSVTQVLSIWNVYTGEIPAMGTAYHREQHEWPNGDAPFIKGEQIYTSVVHPIAGHPKVYIYPGIYKTATGWKRYKGKTLVDLTASVPTTAGQARISIIVVNSAGSFAVRDGAEVTSYDTLSEADFPALTVGDNCTWAVLIYANQTEFRKDGNNNDFIDLRFSGANAGGTALTAHANSHISTGDDPIPGAVAGGESGLLTGTDKAKLDGLAAQVNSDWTATSGDAEIMNKPPIPVEQIFIAEDLSSQVTGATAHFTLGSTSMGIVRVYCGLRQLPSAVTLDLDMKGFTLDFSPIAGEKMVVDYPTYLTNVVTYEGIPVIALGEYITY